MLLVVAIGVTSCLNSSSSEATLYGEAAITSFNLGNVTRYVHKTINGKDSLVKTTLSATTYKFTIDQIQHQIYNTDSLPIGTDVSRALCVIGSRNNSTVFFVDKTDENILRSYSSLDSVDFSTPRKLEVWSSDMKGHTDYTVKVNVHGEDGSLFVWQKMPVSEVLAQLKDVEAHYWAGTMYLEGRMGDMTQIYRVDDKGLVMMDEETTGKLLPPGMKRWIGSTSQEVYGLSDDNDLMVSQDGGVTWESDILDDDRHLLPVQDIAFVSYPLYYATNTEYALLVGNRSVGDFPDDKTAMVWRKIVDNDEYTPEGFWSYLEPAGDMALPRMAHMSLVAYDDGILAIGGEDISEGVFSAPYAQFYQSRDDGITWKYNNSYQLPDGFDENATSVGMAVDDDDYLWLFCGGTGQVWRGRLNKLGWQIKD
jgi:hypothetical protein